MAWNDAPALQLFVNQHRYVGSIRLKPTRPEGLGPGSRQITAIKIMLQQCMILKHAFSLNEIFFFRTKLMKFT